ncbi:MAG: DUF4340 domain-containing protein [Treponema sp.]|nr:DUF4340 domain-containing protein [Treponema sp.]
MKTRKIVLSTLAVVLLCIYIVQLIAAGRSPIKTFSLKAADAQTLDRITLVSAASGTVVLNKNGSSWTVGEQGYVTEAGLVEDIVDGITSVRTLGTVTRSSGEDTLQRFGMDNNTAITVTAFSGEKAVRTLYIGKAASTGDQTYLRMDAKSDIYLAAGSLRDTFGKTQDALRSKEIFALKAEELSAIHVSGKKGTFTVNKAFGESGEVWAFEGSDNENTDSAKISTWAGQIANLTAQSWADAATEMPADSECRVELTAGSNRVSVVMAKIGSEDDAKYLCASSETPYLFYITKAQADRLTKAAEDFTK